MRVLHVTHNDRWFPFHFEFMKKQLGLEGETFFRSISGMDATTADAIWHVYSDYFNSFDAVFVSHCASWSRVFLQNGWKKPLYVWLFFRFDHDVPDREVYYKLIKEAKSRPNVKFIAATEQDKLYANSVLGDFPVEVVPPFACTNTATKRKISCEGMFYLVAKHNESLFSSKLEALKIPIYKHDWHSFAPDLRGVKGILHMPYVCATASLYENWALENIYFLPTESFLRTLCTAPNYFWDSHGERGDFSQTEWYREENKPLFIYYSSFEELKQMSDDPNLNSLFANRKRNLRDANQQRLEETQKKWGEIFS